jgi:hypothetical protein
MCIWLGKQMLGQKDKSELAGAEDGPLRVRIELVGDAVPQQIEMQERQTGSRLPTVAMNRVEWKG